jgi:ATP-dependent Clp protease ATP-binding subunit ClpA
MFERFSAEAREVVVLARQEAAELNHGYIGCEHLLLALADGEGTLASGALATFGLRPRDLRERVLRLVGPGDAMLDEDALASVGIDLDAVRRATEASFGPGALDQGKAQRRGRGIVQRLPFTQRAKKSLELALRTAVKDHAAEISTGHVLLGVIDQRDNAALRVLKAAGVETRALRQELTRRMAAA